MHHLTNADGHAGRARATEGRARRAGVCLDLGSPQPDAETWTRCVVGTWGSHGKRLQQRRGEGSPCYREDLTGHTGREQRGRGQGPGSSRGPAAIGTDAPPPVLTALQQMTALPPRGAGWRGEETGSSAGCPQETRRTHAAQRKGGQVGARAGTQAEQGGCTHVRQRRPSQRVSRKSRPGEGGGAPEGAQPDFGHTPRD